MAFPAFAADDLILQIPFPRVPGVSRALRAGQENYRPTKRVRGVRRPTFASPRNSVWPDLDADVDLGGGNCKGKTQEKPSLRLRGVSWQNQAPTRDDAEAKVPPLQLEQGCNDLCGASSAPPGHKSLLSCLSSHRSPRLLKPRPRP